MIAALLRFLFWCRHNNTGFPITRGPEKATYIVCLDCGKEFPYDWQEMRIVNGGNSRARKTNVRVIDSARKQNSERNTPSSHHAHKEAARGTAAQKAAAN